jgi:hypothetical protein
MSKTMKIYISGKISGLDKELAFSSFEKAENILSEMFPDAELINPMKKVSENENKTWKDYMIEDIALLFDCSHILMLDNWGDSRGAKLELVIAQELGLQVLYQYAL